ncbi:MAG: YtxH domain-containing protein [Coprothermobacterota bacterium]|nr:YtxH domain-containing protein [Coprothermobacterota bacterium]
MKRFFRGFLFGVILGGVIGLLVAPESGPKLRQMVENRFRQAMQEAKHAAQRKRNELQKHWEP